MHEVPLDLPVLINLLFSAVSLGWDTQDFGLLHLDDNKSRVSIVSAEEIIDLDTGVIPNLRNVPMVVYQSKDDPRVPPELSRSYRSLLADMRLALLSEIGARSVTDHLSRRVRDPDLARLLVRLNEEGADSVTRLRRLMTSMGAQPRRTSFRRRALARALAYGSHVTGPRPVLRICADAAESLARWYAEYAQFLLRLGDRPRAQVCEDLRRVKTLHAQALRAFASNVARR